MLAIQFIAPSALRVQGCEAHWDTLPPLSGVDYESYSSVAALAALLELDADGRSVYRIVEKAPARELSLEEEAYLLLERAATASISDADVARLDSLTRELDSARVPYRGRR